LKLKAGSLLNDFQEAIWLAERHVEGFSGQEGGFERRRKRGRAKCCHETSRKGKVSMTRWERPSVLRRKCRAQFRVAQPSVSHTESMFAGVPVFGEGKIAVRLPKIDESADPQFLSFWLSEFRKFAAILDEFYGIKKFGEDSGIPLEDVLTERVCHFSEEHLNYLEQIDFYQRDPGYKLKLIGRRCQGCGLVVSEESRKKEKIGGKNGKGIAKAKCPKCEKPFGDISLFAFDDTPATKPADSPAS
jgi:hypothetical protein